MLDLATPLPGRRAELIVRPLGDHGSYVVKDPGSGAYYHLGEEEHFLLTQLDGQRDTEAVCAAFAERFGQPLAGEELHEFVEMARGKRLLPAEAGDPPPARFPRLPAAGRPRRSPDRSLAGCRAGGYARR